MQRCILLHTNDIHGRLDGLARIATLVADIRAAHPTTPVLFLDCGDSEDTSERLSNLTKGTSMHRLLRAAGCDAAAVGNAAMLRYGEKVLQDHAGVSNYPLLLANLRLPDGSPLPGVQPTAMLRAGSLRLGMIGLTADFDSYTHFFGLRLLPVEPLVRELAASLRQDGADVVVVLSHMGLPRDRELAAQLGGDVDLIVGAHSHDLLPQGERIGDIVIAQAGKYAEHLGRLDLAWDGDQLSVEASVIEVGDVIPPAAVVRDAIVQVTVEAEHFLAEIVGELAQPLDFAFDRESGTGNLIADMLRARHDADLAIVASGQAFDGPLPAGPLQRLQLWEACSSPANPGVVMMRADHITSLVARGFDAAYASERPLQLRGAARGLFHLSGATYHHGELLVGGQPLNPDRLYRVAGTDWEFEEYGGYADAAWNLQPHYDVPVILREALEEYLAETRPTVVTMGRTDCT